MTQLTNICFIYSNLSAAASILLLAMCIIFPFFFNKFIPSIEKQVGRKIKFNKMPYYYLLPKFTHPLFYWGDIVCYIGVLYIWPMNEERKRLVKIRFALGEVGYDVKQAPRSLIIISWIALGGLIICSLLAFISFYIYYSYPMCQ